MRLDISSKAQKLNTEIPYENVTVSQTKEIGSQNLGSKPYKYVFLYTCFIHSFVLPTHSTKVCNN